jgi:hypothetical protein
MVTMTYSIFSRGSVPHIIHHTATDVLKESQQRFFVYFITALRLFLFVHFVLVFLALN